LWLAAVFGGSDAALAPECLEERLAFASLDLPNTSVQRQLDCHELKTPGGPHVRRGHR
jgi:hypothetical protein